MFRINKMICTLLATALLLAGCGGKDQTVVIRIGHSLSQTHTVHKAMLVMRDELARLSGNTMALQIYPSGQLGSERELVELLQIGSLGMTKVSASPLEGFVPAMGIFNLPYLFKDHDHFLRVLDSSVGDELLASVEPSRMVGLGFYDAGSRSFYTTEKIINTPADLKGMKIRVQESQMAMTMIKALGGSPTPIAWGELYTALQQGVVDGQENPVTVITASKFWEVQNFVSLTGHVYSPAVILASPILFDGLTEEEQGWFMEAADASAAATRAEVSRLEEAGVELLRSNGMEVITDIDKAPFAELAAESSYSVYTDEYGVEMVERIQAVQ